MPLLDSSEFQRQRRFLDGLVRGTGMDMRVYAISRFDDDDQTLCSFNNTGYGAPPFGARMAAPLTGAFAQMPVQLALSVQTRRLDWEQTHRPVPAHDDPMNAGFEGETIVRNPVQHGGHAEEMFIRSLPRLVSAYGAPRKVELYLSRHPCLSSSNPWVFVHNGRYTLMPQGCVTKFQFVFRDQPQITWHLSWPTPDARQPHEVRIASRHAASLLNASPNASALELPAA